MKKCKKIQIINGYKDPIGVLKQEPKEFICSFYYIDNVFINLYDENINLIKMIRLDDVFEANITI